MKTIISYILGIYLVALSLSVHAQIQNDYIVILLLDSADNEIISNATVRLLPSGAAIKENSAGMFMVPYTPDMTAVEITHVGYTGRTVPLKDIVDNQLTIHLVRASWVLDDVVIQTGYESITNSRITGAFEQISTERFNRSASPDLIRRLSGVSNILFNDWNTNINRINASPKITIRGESSLYADASPLIILDNFPYEGDLNSINLDEIENVTILKDAAASSIWGARAGNGVIVLTTKKGNFNMPTRIEFNSSVRMVDKPDLFYLPILPSDAYIGIEQMLFENGYFKADEQSNTRTALSPAVELLIRHRDGFINDDELKAGLSQLGKYDVRTDFLDHVYRNELNQRYTLSGSGGNDVFNFRLSGGYESNLFNINREGNQKFTVRTDNTAHITKKLSAQLGVNYAQTAVRKGGLATYGNLRAGGRDLYPYARLVDDNGQPAEIAKDYRTAYTDTAGNGRLLDWKYRPLNETIEGGQKINDVLFNLSLRYQATQSLSAEIRYNYQHNITEAEYIEDQDYYETRNLINRFTVIDGEQLTYNFPTGGILRETGIRRVSQAGRLQVNWNPTFDRHRITALGGAEVRQNGERFSRHDTYGYDKDRLTYSPIDYINYYPVFDGLLSWPSLLAMNPSGFDETIFRDVSFFANGLYDYDGRYSLSLSARKDASNLFGMETNERWKPLWSVGAAWDVSAESWYNVSWMNRLKVRLSHGYSGNIDKSRSAHTILSFRGRYHLTQYPYAFIMNPPNPSLQWETVGTTNLGLDMSLFKGRVHATVDIYQKKTDNLLGSAPIDPTTGFSNVILNNAATKGKGFELNVRSKNIVSSQLEWSSTLLFAYSESKVVKWLSPLSSAGSYVGTGRGLSPSEGNLLYSLYSFKWEGLNPENGNPVGRLDGEISEDYRAIRRESTFDELVYHGSGVPLYHGALLNSFRWKQFTVSANVAFRLGYYFRRDALHYGTLFSGNRTHREFLDRWQKPGDERSTSIPSLVYPSNSERDDFYNNSEVNVAKGDHIRLLDVRLDYAFGSRLQMFVSMANVGIIWRANKWGLDPDFARNIPAPRNYAAGISFKL